MLLAIASCPEDPFDPADTFCAQNNAAALSVAALRQETAVSLHVLGSEDVDGLKLWHEDRSARLTVLDLPVASLPWRDAAMFQATGMRSRPLHGDDDAAGDPALHHAAQPENKGAITAVTDVIGAQRLKLRNGRVTIEGGAQLLLPRLRIAEGASLTLQVAVSSVAGDLHVLHLSGGRRVGGCTVKGPNGMDASKAV